MPRVIEHRSVTPILKAFRNAARGRTIKEPLRFADCLAARTQPHPTIPGGPYHKTSKVYYYTRDARRLVQPPIDVCARKQLEPGKSMVSEIKLIIPGKIYAPQEK
ncbi:PREDICTED: NADH dehydrogenase [ubiquinone] 1 alpha subcomplex subunit 7-like [Dufourea novaeangliae]|uniref:NADH dehydrogenase [ubiquinone] 1 alpha subcomplex subunit 7-like n=1 Tax=Dufourea novaeangliae TaxID=178035 RepID=UPI000766ECC7|nr:PREDICTED: NADH dehydrogenase [ubiquinone] 1 alpha subcomplex subunit 7-like [Dufourea novaeangliae]